MPTVQDTYSSTQAVSFPGAIADTTSSTIVSRTVETAALAFGSVAVQASGGGVRPPDASNTTFVGIAVRDQAADPSGVNQYQVVATAGIMIEGAVYVTVGEAVAVGDPAYFVAATGAIVKTATGNVQIPNARFESAAANGGLAKLRLL